jgi:hypothetical protein
VGFQHRLAPQPIPPCLVGQNHHTALLIFRLAAGQSLTDVQTLLGNADLDHVMPYLEVDDDTLCDVFETVL